MVVRGLRTGRILHRVSTGARAPGGGGGVGPGPATAIVVKRDGAVAWITEAWIRPPDTDLYFEVHALDRRGERLLALAPGIDPASLALAGSRLYWTQGGKPMSATLD